MPQLNEQAVLPVPIETTQDTTSGQPGLDDNFLVSISQGARSSGTSRYHAAAGRRPRKSSNAILWLAGIGGAILLLAIVGLLASSTGDRGNGPGRKLRSARYSKYELKKLVENLAPNSLGMADFPSEAAIISKLGRPDGMTMIGDTNQRRWRWRYDCSDGVVTFEVYIDETWKQCLVYTTTVEVH
jgi:hypothetical protein